jgi:transposase
MGIQGRPLTPEYKKAIVCVKKYFDRTKDDISSEEHDRTSVEKTADALDVGVSTVKRVMTDYNQDPNLLDKKSPYRGHPPRIIEDSLQTITRKYVRKANYEGSHITLEMLSDYLKKQECEYDFSVRTLGRTLDRWGFTFGKGTRSQHLKEKDYVVIARRRYLREKRANRRGKQEILTEVYLDESYVNKNHSNDFIWYSDEDGSWVHKPTGKGERLIIVNAITRNGWIPGARLIFKSTRKTGDYHGQMNHSLFTKWFVEQLLPNIPVNSLIIMDNASYHNVLSEHSAPTATSKKDKIINWLSKNGIPVSEDSLKAELVEILRKIVPAPTYALDEIAGGQGHKILRTPPYHPELQPIETCWAVLKNQIARNCDFTMSNLLEQLNKAFDGVTAKTCSGIINKIRRIEDKFWYEDIQLERMEER